jgi:hypothetical protein
MNTSLLHKAVLLVSGATAVYIGGSVIASPDVFYASLWHFPARRCQSCKRTQGFGRSVLMLGLLIALGAGHLALCPDLDRAGRCHVSRLWRDAVP